MYSYFAILPILSTALCIGLALFTFSRNPRHPANIGFALGMASLTIIETGNAIVLLTNAERQISLLGIRISLIGQALLPASWLFFSIVFARANYKDILSKWILVLAGVGIISIFFSIWIGSSKFISLSSSHPNFILGPIGRYFYIYLIMGLVFNLVQFENTLQSSSGSKKWQIKYVIFGVGAILSFFIYVSSQALLFSTIDIQLIPVISAVILISTSMMTFFIVRHRLMNVNIFISRYVVYNSITVLIVGFYLLTVGITTYGINYFNIPFDYFFTTLFVFISVLASVILFFATRLRRKVQLFINRHFYKHKYEFRDKWMETTARISSKQYIEEIEKTLTDIVSETMGANVYLWIYDPVSGEYHATKDIVPMDFRRIAHNHPLLQYMKINTGPFMINDLERKKESGSTLQNEKINKLVAATKAVLCTPLVTGQAIMGFIMQGEDISGEPYRQDDFDFLKAVTTQAAVQIKNIRLAQDLMAAKEAESFHKISSFIMHDLKNLANSLSLVSQNAKYNMENPEFQHDAIMTIDNTVYRMKGLIEKLSFMPKRLELKKEITDLKCIVDDVLKRVFVTRAKDIVVTNEIGGMPPIYVDPHAIEMVLINIFTNAYEAIQKEKGEIKVKSVINKGYINVTISDNGVGMSKEFIEKGLFQPFKTTKKGGFGIGLYQCKTIVEAHDGKIEVESEEGKGTKFTIKLPING